MKLTLRTSQFSLSVLVVALLPLIPSGCSSPGVQQASLLNPRLAMNSHPHSSHQTATSPLSLKDLELLQGAMLFGDDDVSALRMSLPLVEEHADAILDVWYGFVASTPQLVQYFSNAGTGAPDGEYLAQVRVRFRQWILDTARGEYDREWLDYQHEIGLRHHSTKKNRTDGADSVPIIHFRYLPALLYPVTATLKPFLEKGDHSAEEVERMHQAWVKSVLLQVILWSHPYVQEGEF